MHTDSGLVS